MTDSQPRAGALPAAAPPSRPRPQMRRVTIANATYLTPRMVRLTVAGPELAGFTRSGGAGHVRVWIPNPAGELVFPGSHPEGLEPPPEQRSPTRVYTPRLWAPARHELALDIVLHGEGPIAIWAAQAAVGDRLVVAGPRGEYTPSPEASAYLFAGDESAIPAIATLLELLPAGVPATVLIEIAGPEDEQPLPAPARATIRWLHRPKGVVPGDLLARAVREQPLPADSRVWAACEATAVRAIRRHLLAERGLPRTAVHTRGYWKQGTANHPDHDMGED